MHTAINRARERLLPLFICESFSHSALEFMFAALMGAFCIEGFAPFGAAAVAAAWLRHGRIGMPLAGALIGAAVCGSFASLTFAALYAGISLLYYLWRGVLKPLDKLMLLAAAGLLTMPMFSMGSLDECAVGLASVTTAVVFAVMINGAGRCVEKFLHGKRVDAYMGVCALVCACATVFCAALLPLGGGDAESARLFAAPSSVACAIAGLACAFYALVAVLTVGLRGIAAAAVLAAAYMLGGSRDAAEFACALCVCSAAGAIVQRYGTWAVAGAFLAAGGVLAYVLGLETFGLGALFGGAAAFLALPKRLTRRLSRYAAVRVSSEAEKTLKHTRERLHITARVLAGISELYSMSEESGAALARRQLSSVSGLIDRLAAERERAGRRKFSVSAGAAACPKRGSRETGDSMAIREVEGRQLMLLSDGMGTGTLAHNESASAVALFGDLLSIGFALDEAEEWVNRLLIMKTERDMYATLDVLLIDSQNGEAQFIKYGAPPAYIVRGGKVHTVYSEALPMGIIGTARPAVHGAALKKGDCVVLMTDGLYDALGSELTASLIECTQGEFVPKQAADALLARAQKRGFNDDMSVMVARLG